MSFFIYVTVVTLLLCFKNPVSTTFFKLKIPFFSTVIPSRILFLTSFSLSVLASFGFDLVKFKWAQVKRGLLKALGLVFLLLLLGWGYFIYFKLKGQEMMPILFQRVMFRNLVLPALVLVISTALFLTYSGIRRIRYWLLLLMILFSFAHQIYFLNKSLYFSEKQFLFPEHEVFSCLQENAGISRFMGIGKAKIMPNFASYYGIFSPEGLDPLYSRNYGELVESAFNQGKLKETLPLIEILLPNTLEGEGTSNRWYQNRILSLLGVWYVVTDEVEEPDGSFTLFWENQKFRIWEYEDAFPRASLVYKYKVEKDKQKIIDDLFDPNFSIKDTVVLEEIPFLRGRSLPVQDGSLEPDQARILEYTPNRVVLDVDARRDGLVYLSDNYYPGWNVYVDGDKTKLYKANYSFRAVVVPAGNHQVKFSYQPTSFIFGTTLSILSLVLLVPFSLLMRKYV